MTYPFSPGYESVASSSTDPQTALIPRTSGQPARTVRRLVLRDHEGRVVDVEDHAATADQLDNRARELMAWLRDTAPPLCLDPPAQPYGRHEADPDQTTVIPRVEKQRHG